MIIAVDFDGTICTDTSKIYPEVGVPKPWAREVLARLKRHGHTIIIWTCRYLPDDLEKMMTFLRDYEVPHDYVNQNDPKNPFQPWPKVYADVYIDDHAVIDVTSDWRFIESRLEARGWFKSETSGGEA